MAPPPSNPRIDLAYYGDDFTGSTDVMEALQWAGYSTVLFLRPPSPEDLAPFADCRCVGIAGNTRAMSPDEMEIDLPTAFASLRDLGPRYIHYKTCSTFDSSPEIGSIGKALEIGRATIGGGITPILIGAPSLGRYCVFGNLFARSGLDSEPARLDRHPTMARHPITPMTEADVRRHLAGQTGSRIELLDILRLDSLLAAELLRWIQTLDGDAILMDALRPENMPILGQLIEGLSSADEPLFVLGSSGIEYALTAAWTNTEGSTAGHRHALSKRHSVDQMVVVSGSCSPVTGRQNSRALSSPRWRGVPIDPATWIVNPESDEGVARSAEAACKLLKEGNSVILHTADGPDDARIQATQQAYRSQGLNDRDILRRNGRTLGPKLGELLRRILEQHPLERIAVAGGDTSGFIARALGIRALQAVAPAAPGSPICRLYGPPAIEGTEAVFKGGQVGMDDVWNQILDGTAS